MMLIILVIRIYNTNKIDNNHDNDGSNNNMYIYCKNAGNTAVTTMQYEYPCCLHRSRKAGIMDLTCSESCTIQASLFTGERIARP